MENTDSVGNHYPKLRLGLEKTTEDGEIIEYLVSLDLKSDVAQRLLAKLDQCVPGEFIKVSAWPTTVMRDGRTFINHAASVKDASDQEIKANTELSARIKKSTDAVESTLKAAGVNDKLVLAKAKASRRIELHKEHLLSIQQKFPIAEALGA